MCPHESSMHVATHDLFARQGPDGLSSRMTVLLIPGRWPSGLFWQLFLPLQSATYLLKHWSIIGRMPHLIHPVDKLAPGVRAAIVAILQSNRIAQTECCSGNSTTDRSTKGSHTLSSKEIDTYASMHLQAGTKLFHGKMSHCNTCWKSCAFDTSNH